jgi:hypothetical protein
MTKLLAAALAAIAALCAAPIARAQPTSIVLEANPIPIVEVEINGQNVRLQVDPALPDMLVMNTAIAERLGLRNLPFAQVRIVMDDTGLTGRAARPNMRFANGEVERVTAAIFSVPVTPHADGAIGPGALPYRDITIRLGPDAPGARDIVFALHDPDRWNTPLQLSPEREVQLGFTLARPYSMLNRPAANLLQADRALTPAGELEQREFLLGLSSMMQPVELDAAMNVRGLAFGPVLARTAAPIIGADDESAIFVVAETDRAPPSHLTLGREALSACSSMRVNRRAKQLTLRCLVP